MQAQNLIQNLFFRAGIVALAAASMMACTTPQRASSSGPFFPLPPAGQPVVPPPASQPPPPPQAPAAFIRPAPGPTLARFDGQGNRGIDIGGRLGEPILASAAGQVVYVGSELRGYGNMVIVQHSDGYLTAYAHALQIFVKEKETVKQGQKIAEMGNSDADRVKLHFEIRKQGAPVDPEPYLSGKLH
jgi:lipoprotein NlpD